MEFKDYFSTQSTDYAKYRPHYPEALFEYLASTVKDREAAWDCATGNGQAALGLVPFFDRIIATDPSRAQLENAVRHEKITYQAATAEHTEIPSQSVNLVTVAQALHWFDLEGFYREVKRALKPPGAIAVWCYNLIEISPEIDPKIKEFYEDIVGPYWAPERRLVEDGYRSIPFPFEEMKAPRFFIEALWTLPDLFGYLRTWSATQAYTDANRADPIARVKDDLLRIWGPAEMERPVRWPINMRVGAL